MKSFDEVILTHTCREVAELAYGQKLIAAVQDDPLVGEIAKGLKLYCTTTREDYPFKGRITDLMASCKVFDDLGVPPISPETDRGMICGSMDMLRDTKAVLEGFGLVEGSNSRPSTFVVERAFVD
jgi:ferredoxin--NADP+ reductase